MTIPISYSSSKDEHRKICRPSYVNGRHVFCGHLSI